MAAPTDGISWNFLAVWGCGGRLCFMIWNYYYYLLLCVGPGAEVLDLDDFLVELGL